MSLAYVYVVERREIGDERLEQCQEDTERASSHERGSPSGRWQEAAAGPRTGQAAEARYTAALLKSTLVLMGCKPRVAHKVELAHLGARVLLVFLEL